MIWQDYVPILNIPFQPKQDGQPRTFKELQKGVRDWQKRASEQWHGRIYDSQQTKVFSTPFVSNAKPFLFFASPPPKEMKIRLDSPLVQITGSDYSSSYYQKLQAHKQPFIQQPLIHERAGGNQMEKGPGLSVMKPNPPPFMDAENEMNLVKRVRFIETTPMTNIKPARLEYQLPGPRKSILRRRRSYA